MYIYVYVHERNKNKKGKKNPKFNLSNGEQEVMKHLAKRNDIITTTADKGGAVVIMDTENYTK